MLNLFQYLTCFFVFQILVDLYNGHLLVECRNKFGMTVFLSVAALVCVLHTKSPKQKNHCYDEQAVVCVTWWYL